MFYALAKSPDLDNFRSFLLKFSNVNRVTRVKPDRFGNSLYRLSNSKNNGDIALIMVARYNNILLPSVIYEMKNAFSGAKFNV